MTPRFINWKTQIRKGYLELCLLALIARHGRLYGFDLIEHLKKEELEVKEGTLYPLLNRMTSEGLLKSSWETENTKGHPRKYYSLSDQGLETFVHMNEEFERLYKVFDRLKGLENHKGKAANNHKQKDKNIIQLIKEKQK